MKTMFALLLIAGIVIAAQRGPAFAGESRMRTDSPGQDWWQQNFGRYLSARSMAEIPWLDHLAGARAGREGPRLPKLDTLDPFKLHFADTPVETTASGAFHTR
jgi:hypothetical protein